MGSWDHMSIWDQNGDFIFLKDSPSNPNLRIGLGTETPDTRLHLANDGGILAKQTFGVGESLTTAGAGTRMIWYPRKGAFRAGQINGGQWDDANIGLYSFATGFNTIASAEASTAMGQATVASGRYATAMGCSTQATGEASTALGNSTLASGARSTAMGLQTIASGHTSVAIGAESQATAPRAIALGRKTEANATDSIAMGDRAVATGGASIAMGLNVQAGGDHSIAMGHTSWASGAYSISMGYESTSGSPHSIAMGKNTQAYGTRSISIGYESGVDGNNVIAGDYAISMGNRAQAMGYYSLAFGGERVVALASGSLAIGKYNVINGHSIHWVQTDPLFVIGNGTDSTHRSNALTVLKNGNVGIGTDAPKASLSVSGIPSYADNAAAMAAGLPVGAFYHTSGVLKVVH